MNNHLTIEKTIDSFLDNIKLSRSDNTVRTYKNAMKSFTELLFQKGISIDNSVLTLSEKIFNDFAKYLRSYSYATEGLYINVVRNYFEFLKAQEIKDFNIYQTKFLIKNNTRKRGVRIIHFPENEIRKVVDYALNKLPFIDTSDEIKKLINLRDSALLITLADTGLRIHEACNLRKSDIDWVTNKAIIIGKGDKEAVVRFSNRSIIAIKKYLEQREKIYNNNGMFSHIFARHDKRIGEEINGITTKTGRIIVKQRVNECVVENENDKITPHSFRHYFVTNVLRNTGNIKIAQEFARHSSISVTERYTHLTSTELDNSYNAIYNI